jgi:hypothetical protein
VPAAQSLGRGTARRVPTLRSTLGARPGAVRAVVRRRRRRRPASARLEKRGKKRGNNETTNAKANAIRMSRRLCSFVTALKRRPSLARSPRPRLGSKAPAARFASTVSTKCATPRCSTKRRAFCRPTCIFKSSEGKAYKAVCDEVRGKSEENDRAKIPGYNWVPLILVPGTRRRP